MEVNITTKNFSLTSDLQNHIKSKLETGVKKYYSAATVANVVIVRDKIKFETSLLVEGQKNHQLIIRAQEEWDNPFTSFDLALSKVENKLRKHKDKIQSYIKKVGVKNKKDEILSSLEARKLVIDPLSVSDFSYENVNEDDVEILDEVVNKSPTERNPVILSQKSLDIEHLTIKEAVMKMDLSNLPALLFLNISTGDVDLVYHRKDGNLSWINGIKLGKQNSKSIDEIQKKISQKKEISENEVKKLKPEPVINNKTVASTKKNVKKQEISKPVSKKTQAEKEQPLKKDALSTTSKSIAKSKEEPKVVKKNTSTKQQEPKSSSKVVDSPKASTSSKIIASSKVSKKEEPKNNQKSAPTPLKLVKGKEEKKPINKTSPKTQAPTKGSKAIK